MVDKNKELVVKKDNFITKMFSKIRSIFGKKSNDEQKDVAAEEMNITERKDSLAYLSKQTYSYAANPYDEKRRLSRLLKLIKTDKVDVRELSGADVILVNKLLKDEIEALKSNKLT